MRNTRMFKKIGDKIMLAAAAKNGLVCPNCGNKANAHPQRASDILTCSSCGTKASVAEWSTGGSSPTVRTDTPPATTRIRKEGDGFGGLVWHIPASGKFGFFLIFAIFWLSITIIVSGAFLFAILGGEEIDGDMPEWVLIPFFSIFYIIGFGMLYAAFRQKFMKHRLTVSGGEVRLRKELFGRSREKKLASGTVKSITQEVFYRQNYTPVYGIQIKGENGKIRFGSMLREDEKAWLTADINEAIFGSEEAVAPVFQEGYSRGEGKGVFSIVIPGYGNGMLFSAILMAVIGLTFLIGGFFIIDTGDIPKSGEGGSVFALVFALFDSVFLVVWSLISGAFAIGGIAGMLYLLRNRGSERRIEGNSAEVSIRTYRRGLVMKDVSYPRDSISAVRSSISGSNNGKPMKRVELITTDKAIKIASWIDGDEADGLVSELRASIGL